MIYKVQETGGKKKMSKNSIPRGQKCKTRTCLTLDTLHSDQWEISVLVCGVLVYSGLWVVVCTLKIFCLSFKSPSNNKQCNS
jgi:hypothetical protein